MPDSPSPSIVSLAIRHLLDQADMAMNSCYRVVLVPDYGEPTALEFPSAAEAAAYLRGVAGTVFVTLGVPCQFLDGPLRLATPSGEFLLTPGGPPQPPTTHVRLGGPPTFVPTPEQTDAEEPDLEALEDLEDLEDLEAEDDEVD